jgi:hypothetical protein
MTFLYLIRCYDTAEKTRKERNNRKAKISRKKSVCEKNATFSTKLITSFYKFPKIISEEQTR